MNTDITLEAYKAKHLGKLKTPGQNGTGNGTITREEYKKKHLSEKPDEREPWTHAPPLIEEPDPFIGARPAIEGKRLREEAEAKYKKESAEGVTSGFAIALRPPPDKYDPSAFRERQVFEEEHKERLKTASPAFIRGEDTGNIAARVLMGLAIPGVNVGAGMTSIAVNSLINAVVDFAIEPSERQIRMAEHLLAKYNIEGVSPNVAARMIEGGLAGALTVIPLSVLKIASRGIEKKLAKKAVEEVAKVADEAPKLERKPLRDVPFRKHEPPAGIRRKPKRGISEQELGRKPVELPEVKVLDIKLKEGMLDLEKTQTPPLKQGCTRLYRGEHPTKHDPDVFRAMGKEVPDKGQGGWFTEDIMFADYHRETQGRGARIVYIDIPASEASKYKLKNFPELVAGRAEEAETSYFIKELRRKPAERVAGEIKEVTAKTGRKIYKVDTSEFQTRAEAEAYIKAGKLSKAQIEGKKQILKAEKQAERVQGIATEVFGGKGKIAKKWDSTYIYSPDGKYKVRISGHDPVGAGAFTQTGKRVADFRWGELDNLTDAQILRRIESKPSLAKAVEPEAMTREEFDKSFVYHGTSADVIKGKEIVEGDFTSSFSEASRYGSVTAIVRKSDVGKFQGGRPNTIDYGMTDLYSVADKPAPVVTEIPSWIKIGDNAHKYLVEKAHSEGKHVPAAVLKDYPDLAPKPKPAAAKPVLKKSLTTEKAKPVKAPRVLGAVKKAVPVEEVEPKAGRAMGRQTVVEHFRKSFDIPIKVGRFRQRAAGIYKVKPEVVRTGEANDLAVISHELGHHIESKMLGGLGKRSAFGKLPRETQNELTALGKELYGTRKPASGYRSEGFAEYLSHWLTTDKAADVAPKFTKYFEDFLNSNPDVAKKLYQGRKMIRRWRQQGAVERIYANIDIHNKGRKGRIPEVIRSGYLRFKTLFVDDLAPLEVVEKIMRGVKVLDPRQIDPKTSPTMLARACARTASGKARQMVLHGTFDAGGKTTGISLRDALAPVRDRIKDFTIYAYARRGQDLHKRGINPGITVEDANHAVRTLDNDVFRKALKDVTTFQDNVLQYLKDAGGLSDEAAKTIRELNPVYISLKRSIEDGYFTTTGGKRLAGLGSPVKRIKGSGREIRDPWHSIIENTTSIIAIADKVRVGRALIELAEKTEGAGRFIEKIPAPMQAHRVNLEDMATQLRAAGVDLADADMDQVLTYYSNAALMGNKDNIISFWRSGKREFYEVSPELYRTTMAMDEIVFPAWVDFLFGKPARAIRLGATGLNAGFGLITNPIRDAFTFGLQTEFTRGTPELIGKGLMRRLDPRHTNEVNRLFERSGADMSQFLGLDRKQMKKAVSEVMASTSKQKALNVVSHPIEALKDIFSVTEASPRLAEFEGAYADLLKRYGDPESALIGANLASSDVTVNFRRAGAYGKYINQIVPFWNAQVQGVGRFARFAKEHPTKAAIKGITSLTIPTVGIWMLNKDKEWYRESEPWLRYGFWNIEVGEDKKGEPVILRIPRPFEWGVVFAVAPEMALDYMYTKDPAIAKDGLKYMTEATVPLGANHLPPALKIPIEQWANYDFFKERPIDPYFEVKYESPEDRFSPYTTETAKMIGRTFGLSPRKMEHLIGTSTGGLGMDIVRAGEQVTGVREKAKTGRPEDLPVAGRLFARTPTQQRRERIVKYEKQELKTRVRKLLKTGKRKEADAQIKTFNTKYPRYTTSLSELLEKTTPLPGLPGASKRGGSRRGVKRYERPGG